MIGTVYDVGHRAACQIGNGACSGELHFLVDGLGGGIEGATEDIRETDNVIDLVRIVGTSRAHQHVRACVLGIFIRDFRYRIGQGEDDGVLGH